MLITVNSNTAFVLCCKTVLKQLRYKSFSGLLLGIKQLDLLTLYFEHAMGKSQ